MRLSEALRQGFQVINSNWQLVGTQLAAAALSIIAFLVIVVLPLAVSVAALGTEITDVRDLLEIPSALSLLVTGSVALLALAAALALLFSVFFVAVSVFAFAASSGVIALRVRDRGQRFTLRLFFSEGRRLFSTMLRYATAAGIVFVPLLIVTALLAFLLYSIAGRIQGLDATGEIFLGVFAILVLLSLLLFLFTSSIALFFYGAAAAVFTGSSGFASLREGARFLISDRMAYWLYCILFSCSVLLTFMLAISALPLRILPHIGSYLSVPYQVFTTLVQTYFGLYISSVLFTYFYGARTISGSPSIRPTDNGRPGSPAQGPLPQQ